jgi:hypothetical protein
MQALFARISLGGCSNVPETDYDRMYLQKQGLILSRLEGTSGEVLNMITEFSDGQVLWGRPFSRSHLLRSAGGPAMVHMDKSPRYLPLEPQRLLRNAVTDLQIQECLWQIIIDWNP